VRPFVLSVVCLAFASFAVAQSPDPAPIAPPPMPTEQTPAVDAPLAIGQQHWLGLYLSILQPCVATVQVTFLRRGDVSFAGELYAGSELFEVMCGGGARAIWTAASNRRGDALLIKPGLGIHVLPQRQAGFLGSGYEMTARTYLAADVEISWLHDFTDSFGWEMGVKLGLAGKVTGDWGTNNPPLSFGNDAFPIFNVFWGFRF
jgi:hypothetical protein